MDKNFVVRLWCGLGIFVVAIIALYTFNMIPFKILYSLFALVAGIELLSFFQHGFKIKKALLAILEIIFLVISSIWVAGTDLIHFWYIILGVCGYDIFAYLCGKAIGGKIFKKSRPFPHISKNKTWEGTFCGLIISVILVAIFMITQGRVDTDYYFLFCGLFALVGDLFESFLKRQFKIKDSNEIVIKNKYFAKLEYVVGGTEGHGGFLDRIDSTAFSATVLFVIALFA
ncbi:phosphatidate cytidylyltransferase [Candidatus Saccharibacteria bacterium]|nr:phosphatidate cytidylyltransferase [Candidatus Saccharibacteria bacterium]